MKKSAFLLWLFILAVELISLYIVTHSSAGIPEIIFDVVLILVTLVVGVTVILAFKDNA